MRNRSYTHIPPLNTKKDFRFKAQQTANTKALLRYKAKNDHVPILSYGAGGWDFNLKTAYIQTPRLRGDSPKEIQSSSQGISFGEKGAGKRKIEAQARLDVNFIVSCRFDCFTSIKPYKRLEPRGSDGAEGGWDFNLKTALQPP